MCSCPVSHAAGRMFDAPHLFACLALALHCSLDLDDATVALQQTEEALAGTQLRLREVEAQLLDQVAEVQRLSAQHAALKAKHEQRERDYDILDAEQRDMQARLEEEHQLRQRVEEEAAAAKEAQLLLADQVMLCAVLELHLGMAKNSILLLLQIPPPTRTETAGP